MDYKKEFLKQRNQLNLFKIEMAREELEKANNRRIPRKLPNGSRIWEMDAIKVVVAEKKLDRAIKKYEKDCQDK